MGTGTQFLMETNGASLRKSKEFLKDIKPRFQKEAMEGHEWGFHKETNEDSLMILVGIPSGSQWGFLKETNWGFLKKIHESSLDSLRKPMEILEGN